MAKNSLPSVDDVPARPSTAQHKPNTISVAKLDTNRPESYQDDLSAFRNVNANLPIPHRILMRDILRHLQDTGESLNDGTPVTDKTKVVLWLLENSGITFRRNGNS